MTSIGYHNPISSGCGTTPGFNMILGLGGKPVRGGAIKVLLPKKFKIPIMKAIILLQVYIKRSMEH